MRFKLRHPGERMLIFILLLIIAALLGVLWGFGNRINDLQDQVDNSNKDNSQTALDTFPSRVLIQSAVKVNYPNETAVDVSSNRVVLPELKLSLPLNQLSRDLVYSKVDPADTKTPVQLNTKDNLNNYINNFNDVPCQQRLASLSFNSGASVVPGEKADGQVSLNDGRTMYLYASTSTNCQQFWGVNTPSAVVSLLKKAQSY